MFIIMYVHCIFSMRRNIPVLTGLNDFFSSGRGGMLSFSLDRDIDYIIAFVKVIIYWEVIFQKRNHLYIPIPKGLVRKALTIIFFSEYFVCNTSALIKLYIESENDSSRMPVSTFNDSFILYIKMNINIIECIVKHLKRFDNMKIKM